MYVVLSFLFNYTFIAYFLKKNYSLRQNTFKILRVWERSLISVPIGVYLDLIEVGTWLGTGSVKEHWTSAEKEWLDAAPDSASCVRSVHRRWTVAVKEWPDAEIVLSLRPVRWRPDVWSSEEEDLRIDRTLAAFGQLWSDASGGHRPDAARVRSPSLDIFMIDRTLKLLLTGRWENTVSVSGHSFGSRFTSCELTERWTSESGAASGHSFFRESSNSFALPVPNQIPTPIRSK